MHAIGRILLKVCLGIVMIGLLTVPATLNAKTYLIKAAHVNDTTYPVHEGIVKFGELIDKRTNGKIKVEVYPNGQLGQERDLIEGVKLGTVEMTIVDSGNFAGFLPAINIFNVPFLFRDNNHAYAVADGPVGQNLARAVEENVSVKFLGWASSGVRSVFAKKPVRKPEDMKGMKLRVMQNPVAVAAFNGIGAKAVPMPYGEVYTALQQGVIDAAENDPMSVLGMKFYEVAPYYSLTGHFNGSANSPFLLSMKFYNHLPADLQKAVEETARKAVLFERELFEKKMDEGYKELSKRGMTIINVEVQPFQDAMKDVYKQFEKEIGGDVINAVLQTK